MKDKFDEVTGEIPRLSLVPAAAGEAACPPTAVSGMQQPVITRKPKRLPGQSIYNPPEGARPLIPAGFEELSEGEAWKSGLLSGWVVPVSFVAKDWRVSSRRIRVLLAEGRLQGRQQENGYWEVYYPYRHIMGRRGPPLRRSRKPKKAEQIEECSFDSI